MGTIINLDFGKVVIYGRYMISEVNEGVFLSHEHHDILDQISKTHFHNTTFVYISHRIHSYSVDPMIYFRTSKLPNLVGFVYVSEHTLSLANAQLEKVFLKIPHFLCKNLKDAIQWANEITEKDQHLVLH